ncbi:MAG: DUF559 domain-containing protein, partial [Actinomycetes bacterium]
CDAPPLPDTSEGDHRWLRTIDGWSRAALFDSMWEQAFARRVLAQVSGLGADDVEVQSYVRVGNESFKVDFFIPRARLVLEVDGFSKAWDAPTAHDLEKRNRRDASLQSQGYKVLHFSNAQVQQEPQACRMQVQGIVAEALRESPAAPNSGESDRPSVTSVAPNVPSQDGAVASTPSKAVPAIEKKQSKTGLWIALAGALVAAAVIAVIVVSANNQSQSASSPLTVDVAAPIAEASAPAESTPVDVEQSSPPVDGQCPASLPFKGNINDQGERIVHSPGQQFYNKVKPEMCFASLEFAIANGFRASKV